MPIPENASKDEVFHDLRHGKAYKKTRKKFGKKKAQKQMVARYFKHEREKKSKRHRKTRKKGSSKR